MSLLETPEVLSSSFRDRAGFLFSENNVLYRQINLVYLPHYRRLMDSGLYQGLVHDHELVTHEEVSYQGVRALPEGVIVIRPDRIPFISYPYEWSFGQLKAAALLTLKIQEKALRHGMSLKDASAYNVQWVGSRPVFIDTLSFEIYSEGSPWVAYRQFCQHFLAPLALMSFRGPRMGQWSRVCLDGIPLDLASSLMPRRAWFNFNLLCHLGIHAKFQANNSKQQKIETKLPKVAVSRQAMLAILDGLKTAVLGLKMKTPATAWNGYYENLHNYSDQSMAHKKELIERHLDHIQAKTVWDLGANTGFFSRLASKRGAVTVAFDFDPGCIETLYQQTHAEKDNLLLPLLLDLSNPSPAQGWNHEERFSFRDRAPAELVMALALVHHLAIANNLPLGHLAEFFSQIAAPWVIIEFVPKEDSQVKKLLSSREDNFDEYNRETFEAEFSRFFEIVKADPVRESSRTLYLLRKRS